MDVKCDRDEAFDDLEQDTYAAASREAAVEDRLQSGKWSLPDEDEFTLPERWLASLGRLAIRPQANGVDEIFWQRGWSVTAPQEVRDARRGERTKPSF